VVFGVHVAVEIAASATIDPDEAKFTFCSCRTASSPSVEDMERCLEDLIIRMIYLMTCRKGLSIYPLLLFVVITNKEQSHHRITGWLVPESLTKDSLFAAIQQRLSGMSNIINFAASR
jgi:hypothetical protein